MPAARLPTLALHPRRRRRDHPRRRARPRQPAHCPPHPGTGRQAASPRLDHMLGVNEVFVQLAHHARHRDDAELADWLPERAVAESVGKIVRPDGFGRWREHGRTVAFFVECDNGTEKLDTLLGKLDQYRELADADIRQPILFVVRGMKRHNNFHRRAASHPGVLSGEL
ncbi:MAG: replication-relaxation family protein, partial [Haloechinothrix sp.]